MSKSQRARGHGFERQVANDLTDRLGRVVKRQIGQARDGGCNICVGPFRVECKARTNIASLAWLEQAKRACKNGGVLVVVLKADRKPWAVLLDYDTAVTLIAGELDAGELMPAAEPDPEAAHGYRPAYCARRAVRCLRMAARAGARAGRAAACFRPGVRP